MLCAYVDTMDPFLNCPTILHAKFLMLTTSRNVLLPVTTAGDVHVVDHKPAGTEPVSSSLLHRTVKVRAFLLPGSSSVLSTPGDCVFINVSLLCVRLVDAKRFHQSSYLLTAEPE